jgi:hypothetical protein
MYDKTLFQEKLEQIMDAVLRINRRFVGIETPLDFLATDAEGVRLEIVCMLPNVYCVFVGLPGHPAHAWANPVHSASNTRKPCPILQWDRV